MIELSKCPNCAETDKVTIAGKVFCTKCGSPLPNSTDPAQATTPTPAPNQPNQPSVPPPTDSFPSVSKFQSPQAQSTSNGVDTSNQNTAPLGAPSAAPVTQPSTQSDYTSNTATPVAPLSPQNLAKDGLETPNTNQLDSQIQQLSQQEPNPSTDHSNIPVATVSSPTLTPTPTPAAVPAQSASEQPPVSTITPVATRPVEATSPAPGNLTDITPPTQPTSRVPEHVGSEIMSLDKKDNAVFSDDQLNQLAQITSQPDQMTPDHVASVTTAPITPQPITEPISQVQPTPEPVTETPLHVPAEPKSHVGPMTTQDIKPAPKPEPVSQPEPTTAPSLEQVVAKSADEPKDSHNDRSFAKKTKKGLKPASIALTIVALFLVGAYVWQVNYPGLAFKIASAKAGISASLPGYVPSGWKMLGDIQTNPGTVSYTLGNSDSSKKVAITQTKTDWDSQALAENYVAPKAENYLALQAQGLTIYVYGHNQASWVNKGTWYRIESPEQSLSQDQLIKMATSL